MLLTKVACPHCQTTLKSQRGIAQGWTITCRKCGSPFSAQTEAAEAPVLQAAPFVPPPAAVGLVGNLPKPAWAGWQPAPPTAAITVEAPVPVHALPPVESADSVGEGNRAVVLSLMLGGLLLFLGLGALLALYCFNAESTPSIAGVDPTLQPDAVPAANASVQAAPNPTNPNANPEATRRKSDPKETKPTVIYDPPPVDLAAPKTKTPETIWSTLSAEEQKRVNEAIAKGVQYLRSNQQGGGSWSEDSYALGNAALPGLVLLECGAKPDDAAVQKAATHVRFYSSTLRHTYQLSLAILFLDRLGEKKDRELIQTLALRLIAGQNAAGGWDYHCTILNPAEHHQLLTFLHQTRPRALQNPLPGDNKPLADPLNKPGKPLPNPIPQPNPTESPKPIEKPKDGKDPKVIQPLPKDDPSRVIQPVPKLPPPGKGQIQRPDFLPPHIQQLAIVQNPPKGKRKLNPSGRDDNSNTQFAILALWVARRHDVPVERTMALVEQRFRQSQTNQGGWGYGYMRNGQTPAMTCVGLLGLAMAHGVANETPRAGAKTEPKVPPQDPAIEKALKALGQSIGNRGGPNNRQEQSLYYLWSLERVAMLYNLKTIGNKDWYGRGVDLLLPAQRRDGSWHTGGYPGSTATIDTCFALLFLKRTNLVQDLTDNLRLFMPIQDPDALRKR